jgi:hypothetical protein
MPNKHINVDNPVGTPAAQAHERRLFLLKTMEKGGVAAASASMVTLANGGTLYKTTDGTRCSISGMQSGANSRQTQQATCTGKSPGYWHKYENWIPDQKAKKDTLFRDLFGDSPRSALRDKKLKEIVCSIGDNNTGEKYNTYKEWHWCCAWMNAVANGTPGVSNFPYTPSQVIEIYANPLKYIKAIDADTARAIALEFFGKLEN